MGARARILADGSLHKMTTLALLLAFGASSTTTAPATLDGNDVVWTTPSADAAGSMPIGNGEVVLNVWVEDKTGDLLFYIARTDAMSEISRILKLGRVRVHFSPSPFKNAVDFRQHLQLRDGVIEISGGEARVRVFVDSGSGVIHVAGRSMKPLRATATLECWRNAPRALPKDEQASAWSVSGAPFPLVESADVFEGGSAPSVTWYHRNETSVVPKLWEEQSLTGLPGTFDPLIHRTFGGSLAGEGFARSGERSLATVRPVRRFDLSVATYCAQTPNVAAWKAGLRREAERSPEAAAERRTLAWWQAYWNRSWVFASGDASVQPVPKNDYPVRRGVDSNGQNLFPGDIRAWAYSDGPVATPTNTASAVADFPNGLSLAATIRPSKLIPGRIFDKLTAGKDDGFLFDTYPGDGLRLIVGGLTLTAPHCLTPGDWQEVAAVYDAKTGEAWIFRDGQVVAHRETENGSPVTRGYVLQRYVQACQGRGEYPIKFNGGFYTVEPAAMGRPFNADWRNWGDSQWYQNVRHMYHPMLEQGDFEMMEPFFRLYESVRPLAEARSRFYHGTKGAYFPETMTDYGTYAGGDYGWDRNGLRPADVQSTWWSKAWNQGPELVALMLDRWDYTRDEAFLKRRALPMAESVLRYFDTRFKRDANGKIVLDPTQSIETFWYGVVNDMPSTAGLIAITDRLCALPARLTTPEQRAFFARMRKACPDLPMQTAEDGARELAPAEKHETERHNVENPELYAVWPFRVVSLAHPALLPEARRAYADRVNHLDVGWGYDGNVAALLGLTGEAARILQVKCHNSHPGYRWPATWGPNFDWIPDQNHGGNLLNTANLMLLQGEPLEAGGAIRILPAWPKAWDVDFKLHAPGNTVVHCVAKAGRIVTLEVTPRSRAKDVVWPDGWRR